MNVLKGKITAIKTKGSLSLVTINVGETELHSIVIDTPETAPYLQEGNRINVLFKETEVVIGKKNAYEISLQNRIKGVILSIDKGDLLSRITTEIADNKITSIITTNAVNQLGLKTGDTVINMIKTNEIMLSN